MPFGGYIVINIGHFLDNIWIILSSSIAHIDVLLSMISIIFFDSMIMYSSIDHHFVPFCYHTSSNRSRSIATVFGWYMNISLDDIIYIQVTGPFIVGWHRCHTFILSFVVIHISMGWFKGKSSPETMEFSYEIWCQGNGYRKPSGTPMGKDLFQCG